MKPLSFMLIAGETSGDVLAAELVGALREKVLETGPAPTDDVQPLRTELAPKFFGAGGPQMAAAGVELAFDLTQHSVVGISDVLKNYLKFRRLFNQLLKLAVKQQPDVIICVDFQGFNRRFIHAVRSHVRARQDTFNNWNPKIIQYVSPQVWASRPGRAFQLAEDVDLLLSIIPFEKEWYAERVPTLRVELVGHPIIERHDLERTRATASPKSSPSGENVSRDTQQRVPTVLLLPGSRAGELERHLPVMLEATKMIESNQPEIGARLVLPNDALVRQAKSLGVPNDLKIEVGGLTEALQQATIAIASTGTVTLECAYFGVPTVAIYKTSWSSYFIAKQIVTVKHLAMPNLLANETLYPELLQGAATPENIAREALDLLNNPERRRVVKTKLAQVMKSLGEPGASQRAAQAVLSLLR